MHALAIQLAPVLGAEKSKVPFYIAGGLLVLWALVVSLGLGMRKPDFPGSLAGQRAVAGVTIVLVLGAASTAVATSGTPKAGGEQGGVASESKAKQIAGSASSPSTSSPGSSPTNETSGSGSSTTPASVAPEGSKSAPSSTPPSSPKATTGTPAPPSSPAASATTTLKLAADPAGQLSYNTKQLSAKAGKVTIEMANMSPIEHNVTISEGSKVLGATPTFVGGSKTLALTLKAGTYTFYCSVPGHRQAGMEGTLKVS